MGDTAVARSQKLLLAGAAATIGVMVVIAVAWHRVSSPNYRFDHGQRAARQGDFELAEHYAALLASAGSPDLSRLLRGEMLLLQQEPLPALAALKSITGDGPIRLDAAYLSARCLITLRRLRDAEQLLQFVADGRPDHADARRLLASICYDQGNFTPAIHWLSEVVRLAPADGRPLRLLGLIHKDLGQWDDAILAYEQSLKADPRQQGLQELQQELTEVLVR